MMQKYQLVGFERLSMKNVNAITTYQLLRYSTNVCTFSVEIPLLPKMQSLFYSITEPVGRHLA